MSKEIYYYGGIDFSPVTAEAENRIVQGIVNIFGEEETGADKVYVDFDIPSVVFDGYFENDGDVFAEDIKKVSLCLQDNGSRITQLSLEANDGYCKIGEVVMENGEPVFLDVEAAAFHNATNRELMDELKSRRASTGGYPDNLEICRMLTVSTVHIEKETGKELDREGSDTYGLVVFSKGKYGWWIFIPESWEDFGDGIPWEKFRERLPDGLAACIELANENDCRWLCLDRDGEPVDLPEYDW